MLGWSNHSFFSQNLLSYSEELGNLVYNRKIGYETWEILSANFGARNIHKSSV